MKLKCGNEIYEFKNEPASIEEIFQVINEQLENSDLYFSHLIVDDEEVYESHDAYLFEKIDSVENIEVAVKTVQQFVNDLMLYSESYLIGAIPEIAALVDEFYQGPTQASWEKFNLLLEGIQWLNEFIMTVENSSSKPSNFDEYLSIDASIQEELKNLEEAIENRDAVLIADIISYEIVPLLEHMKQTLSTSIDEVGIRPNAN